jgi:hypothetical protein
MTNNDPQPTKRQTRASDLQNSARQDLLRLFESSPIPTDELLVNLVLYTRASVLAKTLYLDELYRRIEHIPGVIMEFGVWWGANLALLMSLRAIREPYNWTRKVIGFDTFEGYSPPTAPDGTHELVAEGQYSVAPGYMEHLRAVLDYHEAENTMPHVRKYELVKGDVSETIDAYLRQHPETAIALAYLDMQLYEPTKAALLAIRPHLVPGAVVAIDEFASHEFPGETAAVREVLGVDGYRLERSAFLPDRTILTIL